MPTNAFEFRELLNSGFWKTVFIIDIQHFLIVLSFVIFFWVLTQCVLQPYFKSQKIGKAPSKQQKNIELNHFWITVLTIPLVFMPAIWAMYSFDWIELWNPPSWPVLMIQFLIILVLYDTYFYWVHRMTHHKNLFGKIHHIHHASINPNLWSSYNFDFLDTVINASFAIFYFLGASFLVGGVHFEALFFFFIFTIFWNIYGHLEYEILPEKYIRGFILTASAHHIHHTKNNGNFGYFFMFWDRFCGTVSADYYVKK